MSEDLSHSTVFMCRLFCTCLTHRVVGILIVRSLDSCYSIHADTLRGGGSMQKGGGGGKYSAPDK